MALPSQCRFIQANDLTFYIGRAGAGPRLLFLSGTNGDLRNSNSALDSPLIEHFDVLNHDQRGLGQSDKPDISCTIRDYAEDAIAILDELTWDRAHVVGYSFGGMVAQELAIGWPQRVDRLVLAATTAGGAGGSSYPIQDFIALEPHERARRGLEVADLTFTREWQDAHADAAKTRIADRAAAQALYADEPGAAQGSIRQLEARSTHNTFDRLHEITAPTLVLAGSNDGQAPITAQQAMAEQIPGSRFETVEGSHAMLWENQTCYERITAFCLALDLLPG